MVCRQPGWQAGAEWLDGWWSTVFDHHLPTPRGVTVRTRNRWLVRNGSERRRWTRSHQAWPTSTPKSDTDLFWGRERRRCWWSYPERRNATVVEPNRSKSPRCRCRRGRSPSVVRDVGLRRTLHGEVSLPLDSGSFHGAWLLPNGLWEGVLYQCIAGMWTGGSQCSAKTGSYAAP